MNDACEIIETMVQDFRQHDRPLPDDETLKKLALAKFARSLASAHCDSSITAPSPSAAGFTLKVTKRDMSFRQELNAWREAAPERMKAPDLQGDAVDCLIAAIGFWQEAMIS